jgi:hypothetical protein
MKRGEWHETVRTDVAFFVVCDDGVCKLLVDRNVLLPGRSFKEGLCLGRIWDGVVEAGPKDLRKRMSVDYEMACMQGLT